MDFLDFDLVKLVEQDLGPGRRSGRWVIYRCPFHHPDRHPSFAVTNGDGTRGPGYRCFSAACGKHGGPLSWLMDYRQMDKSEAVEFLAGGEWEGCSLARRVVLDPLPDPDYPPGQSWQERALQLVQGAELALWSSGAEDVLEWPEQVPRTGAQMIQKLTPLDWLFSRGLTESTIRFWRLGYIPKDWHEDAARWGLSGKPVAVSKGILIPCSIGGDFWYLKIRKPAASPKKYSQIRGGKPGLYLAPSLEWQETVVFCEGELDALLLWQEAGGRAGVVTLGSSSNSLNLATWGLYLLNTRRRFAAYDTDKAGEIGGEKLARDLHPKILNVPKLNPYDKDLTDYYRGGGDLRGWLVEEGVI